MKTTIDEQDAFVLQQKDAMDDGQKNLEKDVEIITKNEQLDELNISSEQPAIPELSPEDQEAIAQEFARRSKKIVCTELSDDLVKRLEQAVSLLKTLERDVEQKQHQALEKNNQIKEIVQQLMQAGHIQVNEQEFKRSEESVHEYVRLLDDVKNEINEEMARVTLMQKAEIGKEFTVWKTAPDIYQTYVEQRIKQVKHYIKSVARDLNISYSRYCFGFDAQMKRIESIQRFVLRSTGSHNDSR